MHLPRNPTSKGALAVILAFQVVVLYIFVVPTDLAAASTFLRPTRPLTPDYAPAVPDEAITTDPTLVEGEAVAGSGSTPLAHQDEGSTNVAEEPRPTLHFPPDVRFIISLGDSWTMTEFDPDLTGPGSSKNPSAANPLGNPSWPGVTTSKGKNWLGYMASEFNTSLTLVWNFAAGGSTVSDAIVPPKTNRTTLVKQVQRFNTTIGHRPEYAPWTSENAVGCVWFGMNDMSRSWGWTNLTVVVPRALDEIFVQAQVLHDLGLRNFLFFELAPLDWTPKYQTAVAIERKRHVAYCIGAFNVQLQSGVKKFKAAHNDSRISMVRIPDIVSFAVLNPHSHAVPNATCIDDERGVDCLWADWTHPGISIHREIGKRAAEVAWGVGDATSDGPMAPIETST